MFIVFASSLLSLISPWAHSPGRCPRSAGLTRPRPVAPPPLPRRHSDPNANTHTQTNKRRRFSEINPKRELNLRHELSLNLNNTEVDRWLGKFDEELDYRFNHDIPLQRSISLDGGIEIFNYLSTLGSDWSSASEWTLNSSESDHMLEQYRSFEDVPASQIKVKSRRASLAVQNEGRNPALRVLKSYKGVETVSGSLTPQVKKLRKTFSFKGFVDDVKETDKSYEEHLGIQEDCQSKLDIRIPLVRSVSFESKSTSFEGNEIESIRLLRQRRTGTTHNVWLEKTKKDEVLEKKVFMKRSLSYIQIKSSEDLTVKQTTNGHRRLKNVTDLIPNPLFFFKDMYKERYSMNNIQKLKKDFPNNISLAVPTIVVTDTYSTINNGTYGGTSVEDRYGSTEVIEDNMTEQDIYVDASDEVGNESICDCRICREDTVNDNKPLLSNKLGKLFVKLVSLMEFGRKLTCWDDNNNVNEGEMYSCIMHVLKLMFALWLRHLDHNPQN